MQHLDEGTIHAWLDGALDAEESARVEQHAAACAACAAAVAEARGLIAGASRVLSALDNVPGGVLPRTTEPASLAAARSKHARSAWRVLRLTPARAAAAAVLIVAVGATLVVRQEKKVSARSDVLSMPTFDTTRVESMALPPSVAAPAAGPSSQAATSPLRAERAAAERDLAARHDSQSAPNVTVATGAVGGVAGGERRTNRGQRTGLENVAITAAGASGRGEGEGEGVGARREKAGAQRRAFGDVAGANASAGAVRGVGRVAVTVPDTVPPAPPAAALFDRNAEAVAGCYTVTSDRPIGLPSLLSLDTAVTGVGGFAGGLAGEPQARRAAPARARETAVRRLSVRDSARATLTAIPGGYWTEAIQGYPRIVILGTPPRVLQLRVEGAGMLRGTVESEAGITTVTLKRTDCR